ncbi:MAG TPA: hypothetical protein VGK67_30635 [Myxococcales bacterium]
MRARLARLWASPRARTILGAAAGAVAGALYGQYVGCLTGSCPLTSNPFTAGALGAVLGASLFSGERKPDREAADATRKS